jgi:endoglucanase
MKHIKIIFSMFSILAVTLFFACKDKDVTPELVVMTKLIEFEREASTKSLLVKSNTNWAVIASDEWITVSTASGGAGTSPVRISVTQFDSGDDREGTVTFSAGNVTQTTKIFQGYVPEADPANVFARQIGLGWNLGNSLEAISNGVPSETVWGNARTTQRLIDSVKAAGFNAIRIPCAWNGYIEDPATYKIRESWMRRVQEVVDYCINRDMFVILNVHWDGGWLENRPFYKDTAEVYPKHRAIWTQIAEHFKDYSELLLFAGTNEVNNGYNTTPTAENHEVQQAFNQIFVDAVRATGGNNSSRYLVVQSFNTNIDLAVEHLKMNMPVDAADRRLMVEVHYYDPYDFTLRESGHKTLWGKYFVGNPDAVTWGLEQHVVDQFTKMNREFIRAGIPVILGEYGTTWRGGALNSDHAKARNYYLNYVTRIAKEQGLVPFYWDNGSLNTGASGLFNRATGAQAFPETIRMITEWETEYVP